jgi:hypothetical protein
MTTLTKSEIATAVEAVRALSDVIEKLHKALWPEDAGDVLRKLDDPEKFVTARQHIDDRAAVDRTLAALADAERRLDKLEGARDMNAQTARKTWTIS